MKKEALWAAYVSKNPSLNGSGNVTLSAAGLRKMFNQTYDKGHEQGYANGKAYEKMNKEEPKDIFSEMFREWKL